MDLCEKMGATKKRGEKKLTVEEFLPIFAQVSRRRDDVKAWVEFSNFTLTSPTGQIPKGPGQLRRFLGMSQVVRQGRERHHARS
jgi:hypothetical protein